MQNKKPIFSLSNGSKFWLFECLSALHFLIPHRGFSLILNGFEIPTYWLHAETFLFLLQFCRTAHWQDTRRSEHWSSNFLVARTTVIKRGKMCTFLGCKLHSPLTFSLCADSVAKIVCPSRTARSLGRPLGEDCNFIACSMVLFHYAQYARYSYFEVKTFTVRLSKGYWGLQSLIAPHLATEIIEERAFWGRSETSMNTVNSFVKF